MGRPWKRSAGARSKGGYVRILAGRSAEDGGGRGSGDLMATWRTVRMPRGRDKEVPLLPQAGDCGQGDWDKLGIRRGAQ